MPEDSESVPIQAEFSALDLINTVVVKVPAFWPDSAKAWKAWFVQTEAQFALKGVNVSSTKFYYCISSFRQKTANQVHDLIKSPLAYEPYQELKRRLLKLFALDDHQRYEAISSPPLSGDMKPSKLIQMITNPVSFSWEPFSNIYQPTLELTFSGITSATPSSLLSRPTRSTRAECPCLRFLLSPTPLMNSFKPTHSSETPHASNWQNNHSQSPTLC